MKIFSLEGLVEGGRIGPQVLGRQGSRLVLDASHIVKEQDAGTGLWVCPLDRVFTQPRNPVIVFGTPNVALVLPKEDKSGWERFAAFMAWRQKSYIADTKGRVQAGVFFELLDAPQKAVAELRVALASLVGTRKASCAHSVALALHRAGFTAGGKSLRWIYRPSRLAATLWRNGLEYEGQNIDLRVIQTHQSVSDHFVRVWMREANTVPRLVSKYRANAAHVHAPVFDAATEVVEMSGNLCAKNGPKADLGVSAPSGLGVNLGFVFGEQPEFTIKLPQPIDDPRLPATLKPFPGKLNRVTKVKKYVLFSRPVIWLVRKNLSARIEWIKDVPTLALAAMLRRSAGPDRDQAFVYNFTLSETELRLKRLLNNNGRDQKFVAWMLAKHVLQARYQKLCLAGELWCYRGDDGRMVVCMSGNSGTYKPEPERTLAAAEILSQTFQTEVKVVNLP